MRIGVDLMGSDQLPSHLFQALSLAHASFPSETFVIYLTKTAYHSLALEPKNEPLLRSPSFLFHIASAVIETHEEPLVAVRQKKEASLMLGIQQLKRGEIDGLVSAGNTGALVAAATLFLPRLPGIQRAALLALLPTLKNQVALIDVGGNVSCKAAHLVQFAEIGLAYQRCLGIERPRFGLLNVGVESKKGTRELQKAYELFRKRGEAQPGVFVGNVEARDLFLGVVDLLVTDGFTGNVLLKTSEGVSSFIFYQLKELLKDASFSELPHALSSLYAQFDYEEYPGALLCGIEGVVVKCHGQSSFKGLWHGIQGAITLVREGFISKIKAHHDAPSTPPSGVSPPLK